MLFLMLFADPEERDLFAGLFKKYEGALRSRALKIVHNPCDAEDCVATAFEHVGRLFADRPGMPKEFGETRAVSYLATTVANEAKNLVNSSAHRTKADFSYEDAPGLTGGGPSAEELAIRREDYRQLVQLVNGLCEKYRTPLVMHFYLELSDREIAQALSITENYVSVLCLRGRKILQRQLKELREKEGQV